MRTRLSDTAHQLPRAEEAESILRSCVHCGFCNATCPTYQLTGDELDGPRGRIYLIKEMLEGNEPGEGTQQHLDACLSCRACETTCPSGVDYHSLLDIARPELERRVPRSPRDRLLRRGLRALMPHPRLFAALMALGRLARPLAPAALKEKIPARVPSAGHWPGGGHRRRVALLAGCVQPALSPNTNAATARVLDRLGIGAEVWSGAGCCGAVDYHLGGHLDGQATGLARAKRNIDTWIAALDDGVEAIIPTASGCGAFIKEYGKVLADDPAYADKARRVSEHTRDPAELLAEEDLDSLTVHTESRLAFQCPCTLQHGQRLAGVTESVLTRLGFDLTPVPDAHLCCGSAGTYSITQPALARQLRDNKLDALESGQPDAIATANIGCQMHLGAAGRTPVKHWIELLDQALSEMLDRD
ncbi:glycolate oxidase subunit GlcF [Alcanivorax marinus]|uniref:Glycolate oxidase iron-sulfur subunit n=1 Tax=Alloalcanivorax marinus TaxID=1177169 RepID=A0A9Q3UQI0_9GAMM|nr:glycolate oxidase subunit GlcF [Alloalcanivorax marinus]MCC4309744.1 glycolate oxidase subunit GlcF [Alloalcanivorax marinus]